MTTQEMKAEIGRKLVDHVYTIGIPLLLSAGWLVTCLVVEAGQRHYIREVGVTFAAGMIEIGTLAVAVIGGYWTGTRTATKTGHDWTGWITGIASAILIAGMLQLAAQEIPGIGKRIAEFHAEGIGEPIDWR